MSAFLDGLVTVVGSAVITAFAVTFGLGVLVGALLGPRQVGGYRPKNAPPPTPMVHRHARAH